MDKDQTVAVASAFVEKDGKFLFTFDPRCGLWRLPSGKIDFGEKAEDTVVREMKEELQIEVGEHEFVGWGQDVVYMLHKTVSRLLLFFHVKFIRGELKPDPEEIQEYKWLSLEEIKSHENKEPALDDLFRRNPDLKL